MVQLDAVMVDVVKYARENPDRLGDLARIRHLAEATIRRWDRTLVQEEHYPSSSLRRRPAAEAHLQAIELFVAESAAMLRLAGRYDLKTAHRLDRRLRAHLASNMFFTVLTVIVSLPGLLAILFSAAISISADEIDGRPIVFWQRWLIFALGTLLAFAYLTVAQLTMNLLFCRLAPFRRTVVALAQADQDIKNLGERDPFSESPEFEIFPYGGKRAKTLRRQIQRNLVAAERQLTRKGVLGSGYAATKARNIELQARARAAATLALMEINLVREGHEAYGESRRLLRQLIYVTLLRDWSVVDFPRPNEAPEAFRSLSQRLWLGSVTFLTLAGGIVTIIVSLPALRELVGGFSGFP